MEREEDGGIKIMDEEEIEIIVENQKFEKKYLDELNIYIGKIRIEKWIKDEMMEILFLMVGMEIKREMMEGKIERWKKRMLKGIEEEGGVILNEIILEVIKNENKEKMRGWEVKQEKDIEFEIGVMQIMGQREK